jgi:hypothetical protein
MEYKLENNFANYNCCVFLLFASSSFFPFRSAFVHLVIIMMMNKAGQIVIEVNEFFSLIFTSLQARLSLCALFSGHTSIDQGTKSECLVRRSLQDCRINVGRAGARS